MASSRAHVIIASLTTASCTTTFNQAAIERLNPTQMDITSFVVDGRDKALLYGDYSTYHALLAKRLLNSRKKIGIATRNRGKYAKKDQVNAENIAENHEYVHLLLLTSERAWAQAMSFKAGHSAEQKGITGRTRSHIVSRLDKAARTAENLAEILTDSTAGGSSIDVLEAKAYAAMIRGAMQFEKQTWEACLRSYATARVIYSALASAVKGDIFKDLLSETIDPSIRYAAYQLKTPRTVPIPVIARKTFPETDTALTEQVNKLDPRILRQAASKEDAVEGEGGPKTLTWRSREVKIEDAQIAAAWGSVLQAKEKLADKIEKEGSDLSPQETATAYEEVLMTTQDAVDATKQAIDELRGEGVGQSDVRMQSLQITRTAVNYEMISWRIGRNRVLTGDHDGAPEVYTSRGGRRKRKGATDAGAQPQRDPPQSRKLSKLKEKAALYDGTLQNLDSIKELPGVAADEEFASKLDAYTNYFESLKCLAIARSHAIVGNVTNALALINHCQSLSQTALSHLSDSAPSALDGPLNIDVPRSSLEFLSNLLNGELQRHRAIVHIDNLRKKDLAADNSNGAIRKIPLAERLHEYPAEGVDLKNVIQFPPKMALIPMKPIFLDVAWDYIDYDAKPQGSKPAGTAPAAAKEEPAQEKKQAPAKKGWFGFGR